MKCVWCAAFLVLSPAMYAQSNFGTAAAPTPLASTDSTGSRPTGPPRAVPADSVDQIAGDYKPDIEVDKFTGSRTAFVQLGTFMFIGHHKHLKSECSTGDHWGVSFLGLMKLTTKDSVSGLVLEVGTSTENWLFVGDEPLLVIADTMHLSFKPIGRDRSNAGGGGVSEYQKYWADPADLRVIAGAQSVDARVQGRDGHCDFPIPMGSRATITQFLRHEYPAGP